MCATLWRAINRARWTYLEKPVDLDELIAAVDDALGAPRDGLDSPEGVTLPPGVVAKARPCARCFSRHCAPPEPTRPF